MAYSEEDAKEVLRRALEAKETVGERFSHSELRNAAEEIGIAPEEFEMAALSLRDEREAQANLKARFQSKVDAFIRRAGFALITGGFLFAVFGATAWFTYPAALMGFFLTIRAFRTFFPEGQRTRTARLAHETERVRRRRAEVAQRVANEQSRKSERSRAKKRRATLWAAFEETVLGLLSAVRGTPPSQKAKKSPARAIVTPPPRMRADASSAKETGQAGHEVEDSASGNPPAETGRRSPSLDSR